MTRLKLRHQLRRESHLCAVAIQFYTRIPVRLPEAFEPADLNCCLRYFPLIGVIIGLISSVVLLMFSSFFDPQSAAAPVAACIAATVSVAVTVFATGAFHEDGLADMMDGLGGGHSRQQRLDIMKDSRIGTYGASALLLALALKIGLFALIALQSTAEWMLLAVICSAAVASRCCAALLIGLMPYARDDSNSKIRPVATGLRKSDRLVLYVSCITALLLPLGLIAGVGGVEGSAGTVSASVALWTAVRALAALIGLVYLFRARLNRLLDGYTGDCLGALQQCAELTVLLILAAGLFS